jgi:glucose-6-phosphate 1-dehydrogenase
VTPLLEAFASDAVPLATYPAGSWGPAEADVMMHGEHGWRVPS